MSMLKEKHLGSKVKLGVILLLAAVLFMVGGFLLERFLFYSLLSKQCSLDKERLAQENMDMNRQGALLLNDVARGLTLMVNAHVPVPSDWQTFRSRSMGITLSYPDNFLVDDRHSDNYLTIYYHGDLFSPVLSIVQLSKNNLDEAGGCTLSDKNKIFNFSKSDNTKKFKEYLHDYEIYYNSLMHQRPVFNRLLVESEYSPISLAERDWRVFVDPVGGYPVLHLLTESPDVHGRCYEVRLNLHNISRWWSNIKSEEAKREISVDYPHIFNQILSSLKIEGG